MDIISSLATLSFDKRRSEFFTKELLILLKLVDRNIISKDILYGSWAGAFGNFQLPRTIRNYAIDYNKNKLIELKNIELICLQRIIYKLLMQEKSTLLFKIELKDNIPKNILTLLQETLKIRKK